jgi:hypothetical protein
MGRKENLESLFRRRAKEAGLDVHPPEVICSFFPVEDRNGKVKKTKTCPDAYVYDPISGNDAHVEITNGRGKNEHKAAQARVAKAAGMENYYQLTGNKVRALEEVSEEEVYRLLCSYFGWEDGE